MYFDGDIQYDGKACKVFGNYTHIPEGASHSAAPEFEFLTVIYNIKDKFSGENIFTGMQGAYIFIRRGATSIGAINNQRPEPFIGEPWESVKRVVLETYDADKTLP